MPFSSATGFCAVTLGNFLSSCNDLLLRESSPCIVDHVVIGNPAGDADSIISALALAHVESILDTGSDNASTTPNEATPIKKQEPRRTILPIVSIPRADLSLRQETKLLLEMANVDKDQLVYLDDLHEITKLSSSNSDSNKSSPLQVTLVDHNHLVYDELRSPPPPSSKEKEDWQQQKEALVVEILDHHLDEGHHASVQGSARNIAFTSHDGKALVGSTCTLVVERFIKAVQESPSLLPLPADLGLVLLGVILLDTLHMSPQAGKGTSRDQAAIDYLFKHTDWKQEQQMVLSSKGQTFLDSNGLPKTRELFKYLSESKFDIEFWESLSVRDALRLDYKEFNMPNNGPLLGASSVLLPFEKVLSKADLATCVANYMTERSVDLLVILCIAFTGTDDDKKPQRSLILCGRANSTILSDMARHLESSATLGLYQAKHEISHAEIVINAYQQENAKASRKQVVPIMMDYYESNK